MELPKYTTDYTPEKIQEIILEGEKTNNRSYYCRVTIQRRGSTGEYIGDLYLEEDHGKTKEDTKKDGRACRSVFFCFNTSNDSSIIYEKIKSNLNDFRKPKKQN